MTTDERKILARQQILWTGNLADDCTAKWAGLMLRAECMDKDRWWWAVYDMQRGEITIEDSNEHTEKFTTGEAARKKAESVALAYLTTVTSEVAAKYYIDGIFKITGRGIVFAGHITEGIILTGYFIEFTAFSQLRQRKIGGVSTTKKPESDKVNVGLLINCISEAEIDELLKWNPENEIAIIYKSKMTGTENTQSEAKLSWWKRFFG